MKQNTFKWAWGDHEATTDPLMTRARAAVLLRAWRRSKTQGRRNLSLQCVRRPDAKFYCVSTTQYVNNDAGILVIPMTIKAGYSPS